MPPVHIDYEMVETEMAEDIEVSLRRTHDMGVSKNREDLERHSDVMGRLPFPSLWFEPAGW